jgi:transcriptional regulator with XRE-family HTH domain
MEQLTPAIVKARATAAHMTIRQLMLHAGLPESTFWRWETGKVDKPHPVTVQKISDALDAIEKERAQ